MYNKIDIPMLILTFFVSLATAILCFVVYSNACNDVGACIICSGLCLSLPLVASLLGIAAVMAVRGRRYVFKKIGSRPRSIVIALVIGSLLGGVGQALYMFEHTPGDMVYISGTTDTVLLIDGSGSMAESMDSCKEAAKLLIDGMSEDNRMQIILFASKVLDSTELVQLDSSGKQTLKDFIDSMDTLGMTNFDDPLEDAYQTLEPIDSDAGRAVIMLTDGEGVVSDTIKDKYQNEGIVVYSVSLGVDNFDSDLADFINRSGGENFSISKDANGNADVDEILEALSGAYIHSGGGVDVSDGAMLLLGSEGINIFRFLVRFVVLALYGVLVSYTMYFTFSLKNIGYGAISGLIAAAAVTVFGNDEVGIIIYIFVLDILYWCAFTRYYNASGSGREVYYV